jgi:hypothetical protein
MRDTARDGARAQLFFRDALSPQYNGESVSGPLNANRAVARQLQPLPNV